MDVVGFSSAWGDSVDVKEKYVAYKVVINALLQFYKVLVNNS